MEKLGNIIFLMRVSVKALVTFNSKGEASALERLEMAFVPEENDPYSLSWFRPLAFSDSLWDGPVPTKSPGWFNLY